MPNTPTDYAPREPSGRIEEAPASENIVNSEPEPKPTASKGKGRTTKARKPRRRPTAPKAHAADRLPLDEPGNEVDVQFSSPATPPDEDKP